MTNDLASTATHVITASDYLALFGEANGDLAAQSHAVKQAYRKLARVLHPDGYPNAADKAMAEPAFKRLAELYEQATTALQSGTYGQRAPLLSISTRHADHQLHRPFADGDLAQVYVTTSTREGGDTRQTVSKVAYSSADNDLMQAEATALKILRGPKGDPARYVFVPELIDSFAYSEGGKPARTINVLARLDGFYTLEQVRKAYPSGVSPLDMAWMWRRLLLVLGYTHRMGIIHGAVVPTHVMILPPQHGLVLVDWCYSARAIDGSFPPIKAVVESYRPWYPDEVLRKQAPGPATDIALAARCMVALMGGDPLSGFLPETRVPKVFRAHFAACLAAKQSARPDDAWQLIEVFDELLERLGTPYFPRRFHAFTMPSGVA